MEASRIAAALSRAAPSTEPTLELVDADRADRPPRARRVGLLPGSFDPMTMGHAALAEALRAEGCDLVLLVLSVATLPKEEHRGRAPEPPLLSAEARVASLVAFARPRPWAGVAVASHGLLVDQAEAAARVFAGAELVVAIGSDKLLQLLDARWYEDRDAALERLFAAASVAYAVRAGDTSAVERALDAEPRWRDRLTELRLPPDVAGVSSRDLRRRRRLDAEPFVPQEVRAFLSR